MKLRRTLLPILLLAFLVALLSAACGQQMGPSGGWSGLVLADETLYVGTSRGEVVALDTADRGRVMWRFPRMEDDSPPVAIYSTPLVKDGRVYVGAWDGNLYVLDTMDGFELGNFPTEGPIVGSVVAEGDLLFVGSSDGHLYAMNGNAVDDVEQPLVKWRFRTQANVWAAPTVKDGVVYFGSLDHHIYALEAETGKLKWQFEAEGGITTSPLVLDGRVYVGALDRKLYALDATSGTKMREFDAKSWFWGGVATDGTTLYAPSLDGVLYALSKDLELRWSFDLGAPIISTPAVIDDKVVVVSEEGVLHVLDSRECVRAYPLECDSMWTTILGSEVRAPLLGEGNLVFVNDEDNRIQAINIQAGRILWTESTTR